MEEQLLSRILFEIESLKRLDPYQENINTNFVIHMLEKQYSVLLESIKTRNIFCDCCSKQLNHETQIFEINASILCEECIEIKMNAPIDDEPEIENQIQNIEDENINDEDKDMNELTNALNNFNTN